MSIWTQADLDAAKAALAKVIANGAASVTMPGGEVIQYQQVEPLRKLIREMARDLGVSSGRKISVVNPEIPG